jgi:hypothetical protein
MDIAIKKASLVTGVINLMELLMFCGSPVIDVSHFKEIPHHLKFRAFRSHNETSPLMPLNFLNACAYET